MHRTCDRVSVRIGKFPSFAHYEFREKHARWVSQAPGNAESDAERVSEPDTDDVGHRDTCLRHIEVGHFFLGFLARGGVNTATWYTIISTPLRLLASGELTSRHPDWDARSQL